MLKNGVNKLIEKYPACATYELAVEILKFIRQSYENCSCTDYGCQKYIDALNIGIDAIKEKI